MLERDFLGFRFEAALKLFFMEFISQKFWNFILKILKFIFHIRITKSKILPFAFYNLTH